VLVRHDLWGNVSVVTGAHVVKEENASSSYLFGPMPIRVELLVSSRQVWYLSSYVPNTLLIIMRGKN